MIVKNCKSNIKKQLISLTCLILCSFLSVSCEKTDNKEQVKLTQIISSIENRNPFSYPLAVQYSPGKNKTILLCIHAFGGNSQSIMDRVRPYTSDTIISFNFKDHDFSHDTGDDQKTVMATPMEIMPLIYMLKELVVENKMSSISLYGYALGAAEIIYAIDFLLKEGQGEMEKKYNITLSDKRSILDALKKGRILFDVPFKSLDEVINLKGSNKNLIMYKERMAKYGLLNPIDTLAKFKNLNMTFLVFFDTNNNQFSTQEDSNFVKRLLDANPTGTNIVIMSDSGGYSANHEMLWKIYASLEGMKSTHNTNPVNEKPIFTQPNSDEMVQFEKDIGFFYGAKDPQRIADHYINAIQTFERIGLQAGEDTLKNAMMNPLKKAYEEVQKQTSYKFDTNKAAFYEFQLLISTSEKGIL